MSSESDTKTNVQTINAAGYTADLSSAGVLVNQDLWNQAQEDIKNAASPCVGGSTFLGAFTDPTFYIFLVPALIAFILGVWWAHDNKKIAMNGTGAMWFFGIIWLVLYLLISYTAYRGYYLGTSQQQQMIIGLFYLTIIVLIAWEYLYFVAGNPSAAFVTLIVAFVLGLLLLGVLVQIDSTNGWIFGIYVLWLLIAMFLSFGNMGQNGASEPMKWY